MSRQPSSLPGHGPGQFATTHWSIVLRAVDGDDSKIAHAALTELCESYWYPVYCFVRAKLRDGNDAADVVQGFFLDLLENSRLEFADQQRGRFRSFLLASANNYLKNWHRNKAALKRGGQQRILSLDFEDADRRYQIQAEGSQSPERDFERVWALELIELCFEKLQKRYVKEGKGDFFEAVSGSLMDGQANYASIAAQLAMTENSVKVGAWRMRQRLGEQIREQIARTVDSREDIETELADLMNAIQS